MVGGGEAEAAAEATTYSERGLCKAICKPLMECVRKWLSLECQDESWCRADGGDFVCMTIESDDDQELSAPYSLQLSYIQCIERLVPGIFCKKA